VLRVHGVPCGRRGARAGRGFLAGRGLWRRRAGRRPGGRGVPCGRRGARAGRGFLPPVRVAREEAGEETLKGDGHQREADPELLPPPEALLLLVLDEVPGPEAGAELPGQESEEQHEREGEREVPAELREEPVPVELNPSSGPRAIRRNRTVNVSRHGSDLREPDVQPKLSDGVAEGAGEASPDRAPTYFPGPGIAHAARTRPPRQAESCAKPLPAGRPHPAARSTHSFDPGGKPALGRE